MPVTKLTHIGFFMPDIGSMEVKAMFHVNIGYNIGRAIVSGTNDDSLNMRCHSMRGLLQPDQHAIYCKVYGSELSESIFGCRRA